MNWFLGAFMAMAALLAGALIDGPTDAQAAQDTSSDAHAALLDASAQAKAIRADAAMAQGQAELQRLQQAMAAGKPADVSEADWAMAQRALRIALGDE